MRSQQNWRCIFWWLFYWIYNYINITTSCDVNEEQSNAMWRRIVKWHAFALLSLLNEKHDEKKSSYRRKLFKYSLINSFASMFSSCIHSSSEFGYPSQCTKNRRRPLRVPWWSRIFSISKVSDPSITGGGRGGSRLENRLTSLPKAGLSRLAWKVVWILYSVGSLSLYVEVFGLTSRISNEPIQRR